MLLSTLIAGCSGCADSSTSALPGGSGNGTPSDRTPHGLLEIAIDNLNRQEEFPGLCFEAHPAPDDGHDDGPNVIPLSGEMLQQIADQLNQWVRAQEPRDDWKLDPLVAALPAPLAEIPAVRNLDQLQFPRSDGIALQEAIWLRNVSSWARGTELDDLVQANRLFDWTVRNIQLEVITDLEAEDRLRQMPWETLFLGRGTAVERVWVFILLARQQGLDAALLVAPDPNDPTGGPPRPWVAVGILNRGNVYVFDPVLGLPLPTPDGIRLGDAGQLEIRPATLAQLAADDSLLRRLDLDQTRPYPVSSSGLDRVVALIEASPAYLARRMKLVESPLLGGRRVVLSTSATAQVARWKAAPQIADAHLWTFPYSTLLEHQNPTRSQFRQRVAALVGPFYATLAATAWNTETSQPLPEEVDPFFLLPRRAPGRKGPKEAPLRKARILHLKGQFTGPQGATESYQEARPSDEQLAGLAKHYYRMALEDLQKLPQEQKQAAQQQFEQLTAKRARLDEPLLRRAKQDASYWLGLMSFDQGLIELQRNNSDAALKHYRVAIDYLLTRTLEASPELHVATLTIRVAPAQDKPQVELTLEPGPMLPGTSPNQSGPVRPQPLGITTSADGPAADGTWSVDLLFPEPLGASDEKRTARVRQIRLRPQFDPKACQLENPEAIEAYLRIRLGDHLGIPRWEELWKDERFVFPKQFDAKGACPIKILAHQQPAALPWTHGARYNLARSYEATRQYDEAVALYLADPTSPAYLGNFLRARWLNQLRPDTDDEPPKAEAQKPGKPD